MEIEREYAATYVGRIRKYYTCVNYPLTDDFGVRIDSATSSVSLYTNTIEFNQGGLKSLDKFADYIVNLNEESSDIFFECLQVNKVYFDDEGLYRFAIAYIFEGYSTVFETDFLLSEDACINLSNFIKQFIKTNFPT